MGGGAQRSFGVFFSPRGRVRAAMGGGAQRPFGVFFSPKGRVRAAHGRAREAKTH